MKTIHLKQFLRMKTLSKWSQAIKIWKKEHDLHRSYKRRYFCVITSTINTNSTHKSPVTWLEGSKRLDSSETNLNRNFELIRCRINPSLLLSSSNTLWHVDIIEVGRRNRSAIIRGLNYLTVISYSLHSHSNNTQLRYSGYPLVSSNPNFHQEINSVLKSQSRICACIGSIRPYQSPRPLIGIPSLLEQIEHLLGLGVSHIYLGLMMTWDSPLMKKYEYIFSSYLKSNQVSLVSTSLPSFQDISGFDGIYLNDTFADIFFYNYCLQQVQGLTSQQKADDPLSNNYLLFMKANQFLFLEKNENGASSSQAFLEYLQAREQPHGTSFFTAYRHYHAENRRHHREKSDTATSRRLDPEPGKGKQSCSFSLTDTTYGITDNTDRSTPFGPADFFFFQSYYQKGNRIVSISHPSTEVCVVNPAVTHAIDVLPSGKLLPLCSSDRSTDTRSPDNTVISSHKMHVLTYDEDFSRLNGYPLSASEMTEIHLYHNQLFQSIHQQLLQQKRHNHTSIADIQTNLRHFQQFELQKEGKVTEKIQDRKQIRLPFWQPCNTDHLSEIYMKIFQ